ncbi:hypothetical protein ABEB36_007238 [Hypothenemus hampei]|uniref:Tr-type G domain-containing protein n=1 Tax=Hypothenemus hampei TaxID=57062 RepID=A0ABD1EX89_HYPHA
MGSWLFWMVQQVPGVEAQTLTVWRQADRYNLPRIVYVNKMDRSDSNIHMCCASVEKKFDVPSVLLQLPHVENGKFVGVVDVLSLELIQYGNGRTKDAIRINLSEKSYPKLFEEAQKARVKLIEQLSDCNDQLANQVINSGSFDSISSVEVVKTLQKMVKERNVIPIVLGSSYKNIGIQSLMDAVILYLPSPNDRSKLFSSFEDHFCGRAFKVKHDKRRGGPLTFVRLYNGTVKKGQKIFNITRRESDQIGRIYVAYADDFREVDTVENGNIAVLAGLKKTMSGDLLTTSQTAYDKAKKITSKNLNMSHTTADADNLFGISAKIPEPVFFCSIEPPSTASQQALDQALIELQREDPSLRVTYNLETGQTVLAGMGELHLEIIRDRILKEYKIDADLGPLQIAYRETPLVKVEDSLRVDTKIGNVKNSVLVRLSIIPVEDTVISHENILKFDKLPDNASNIASIFPKHMQAIRQGIDVGLNQGPKIGCQIL